MYIDQGEIVRVRTETDEFYDDEPGPPKAAEGVAIQHEARRPPYTVIVSLVLKHDLAVSFIPVQCSIAEQGLGPIPWWRNAQPEEDAMEEG